MSLYDTSVAIQINAVNNTQKAFVDIDNALKTISKNLADMSTNFVKMFDTVSANTTKTAESFEKLSAALRVNNQVITELVPNAKKMGEMFVGLGAVHKDVSSVATSVKNLATSFSSLYKISGDTKKNIDLLHTTLATMTKASGTLGTTNITASSSTAALGSSAKVLTSAFNNLATITKAGKSSIEEFTKSTQKSADAIAQSKVKIKALEDTIKKMAAEIKAVQAEQTKMSQSVENLNAKLKAQEEAARKAKEAEIKRAEAMKQSQNTNLTFAESIQQISSGFMQLSTGLNTLISPMTKFGKESINVMKDFEYQMARVKEISKDTSASNEEQAKQYKALNEEAKRLGAETMFTATDSAKAMEVLAQSGKKFNDIMSMTNQLLDLSLVGNLGLERAAEIVVSTLTQYNIAAEESTRVIDVLASASINSAANIDQLGVALKYVGPVAAAMGVSLEETVAILMAFGNAGIKGSMAGTTLRNIITQLTKKTEDNVLAFGDQKIAMYDVNGASRNLIDVVAEVTEKMGGMSDAERDAAVNSITTARSMVGVNVLYQQGSKAIEDNIKILGESAGTAKNIADELNNTVLGHIKKFESAMEKLKIELGDKFSADIKKALDGVVNLVRGIAELPDWVLKAAGAFIATTTAINLLISGLAKLSMSIASITLGFMALKSISVGTFFASITTSVGVLTTALSGGLATAFGNVGIFLRNTIPNWVNFARMVVEIINALAVELARAFGNVGIFLTGIMSNLGNLARTVVSVKTAIVGATVALGTFAGVGAASVMTGAKISEVWDNVANEVMKTFTGVEANTKRHKKAQEEHVKTMIEMNNRLEVANREALVKNYESNKKMIENIIAVGDYARSFSESSAKKQIQNIENYIKSSDSKILQLNKELTATESSEKGKIKAIDKALKEKERIIEKNLQATQKKQDGYKQEELDALKEKQDEETEIVKEKYSQLKKETQDYYNILVEEAKTAQKKIEDSYKKDLKAYEDVLKDKEKEILNAHNTINKAYEDNLKQNVTSIENSFSQSSDNLQKIYSTMISNILDEPERTYKNSLDSIVKMTDDSLRDIETANANTNNILKQLYSGTAKERIQAIETIKLSELGAEAEILAEKIYSNGQILSDTQYLYNQIGYLTSDNKEESIKALEEITNSHLSENAKRLADTIWTNSQLISENDVQINEILKARKQQEESRRLADLQARVDTAKTQEAVAAAQEALNEYLVKLEEDKTIEALRERNKLLAEDIKTKTAELKADVEKTQDAIKEKNDETYQDIGEIVDEHYLAEKTKKLEALEEAKKIIGDEALHSEAIAKQEALRLDTELQSKLKRLNEQKQLEIDIVNLKFAEEQELRLKNQADEIKEYTDHHDFLMAEYEKFLDNKYLMERTKNNERFLEISNESNARLKVIEKEQAAELKILQKAHNSVIEEVNEKYTEMLQPYKDAAETQKEILREQREAAVENLKTTLAVTTEAIATALETETKFNALLNKQLTERKLGIEDITTAMARASTGWENMVNSANKTYEDMNLVRESADKMRESVRKTYEEVQAFQNLERGISTASPFGDLVDPNAKIEKTDDNGSFKFVSPKFAEGGLVSSPTVALVGEGKYPEAVLPLSDNVFSMLADGIVKALGTGTGKGNTAGSNYTVNINDNGNKIFKETIDVEAYSNQIASKVRNQLRYSF